MSWGGAGFLLFVFVGVAVSILSINQSLNYQKKNCVGNHEFLISRTIEALTDRFGVRIHPHRGVATPPSGAAKWYVLYRTISQSRMLSEAGPLWAQTDLLIKDHEGRYWHILSEATNQSEEVNLKMNSFTELRIRRALFNSRNAYFHAFGEQPDVDKIQKMAKKSA
jgi:hypothetical protein